MAFIKYGRDIRGESGLAKVKVRFGPAFYADDILPHAYPKRTRFLRDAKYQAVIDHLKHSIAAMIEEMRGKVAVSLFLLRV